jgi:hypothetical protein
MNIMGSQDADKTAMLTLITIEQWAKMYQRVDDEDHPTFNRDKFVMACIDACGINWKDLPIVYIPNLVADVLAVRVSEEKADDA